MPGDWKGRLNLQRTERAPDALELFAKGPHEATGTFEYYGDAPSPLLMRSSSFPNTLEDAAAAETRVAALPAALNGIVDKPGDVDLWRVSVKKGERYRVRVYAAALGLPLQPKIRIMPVDADGKPGKEAEPMAFPRNSPVAGEHAPDDGAVEQANQQGAQDGSGATFDHAKR